MKYALASIVATLFVVALADEPNRRREYSGIALINGQLTVVDDQVNGRLIRLNASLETEERFSIVSVAEEEHVPLGHDLAADLESIGRLGDGRVVVLSERLRCLIDRDGIVTQYPENYNEIGNRGLEGVAIRAEGRDSQIALCWEGGYLQPTDVPLELEDRLTGVALDPVVMIHKLGANERPGEVTKIPAYTVKLDPPSKGYRFRMPDLEWIRTPSGGWGLLGLVSAENPQASRGSRFRYHWLVLFKLDYGEKTLVPIGEPIDLEELLGEIGKGNWEGVCWIDDHRLALCYDSFPPGPPRIAILNLRKLRPDWLYSSR